MTQKTLLKKVESLKALEQQKKDIEKQMEALQADIKAELKNRGTEETAVGDWMVRFKTVVSNRFNTKSFAAEHPRLYKKYMAASESMRFTVTAAQG